jgi:protein SCO1
MAGSFMLNKILTILLIALLYNVNIANSEVVELPILSGVGGDFTAVDSNGNTIEFNSYAGNVVVLAFGYTSCADICPFTLGYLKQLYNKLSSEEQQKVRMLFVTVDPEYDTPEHLKAFLGHFNEDFIGISGSKEQTDYIVSLYQAEYNQLSAIGIPTQNIRRVQPKLFEDESEAKEDTATLFSHSVSIYLVDKDGFTRSVEYTGTPKDEFSEKIKQLINE